MPLKNSQEISKPDPDHEAEQADDIDGGELADALLPELRKFDSTPIEKNVRMKKITRNMLASPIAAGTFAAMSAGVAEREIEPDQRTSPRSRG